MTKHNYLAIAVLVIACMALGFIWYVPLFGETWSLAAFGKSPAQMQADNAEMFKSFKGYVPYIVNVISIICTCFFISWLIQKLNIVTFSDGLKLGLAVCIGVVFPIMATHYAFLFYKDNTVLLIDLAMSVVSTLLISGVLAAWRKN